MRLHGSLAPLQHSARYGWALLGVPTAGLSLLLVSNVLPYLDFGVGHAFLLEKGTLALSPLWRTMFFAHVGDSVVCLLAGPVLLSGWSLRGGAWLHRLLGRAYVLAVLALSGPAGLYLALHAKGGLPGQVGFALLGILWIGTTWLGLCAIRQRRRDDHIRWMCRSYALTTSALSFRLLQAGLYLGTPISDRTNYITSLWLSLAVSIGVGELLARWSNPRS